MKRINFLRRDLKERDFIVQRSGGSACKGPMADRWADGTGKSEGEEEQSGLEGECVRRRSDKMDQMEEQGYEGL